jgi:lipid-A-disaccharide synthase-like uncharacterized protein
LIWGSTSTAFLSLCFFYQWIISEQSENSTLPLGFWVISIIGCTMLLIYGIIRRDPVLIPGQLFSNIIYSRNIVLLRKTNAGSIA